MKNLKVNDMLGKVEESYIPYQQDDRPTDEISMLAISELTSRKKLKTVSRIKFEQVPILTKLYTFADVFGEQLTKKLADNILQLQISTYGLGRKEFVQLVQQRNMMIEQPLPKRSKEVFR